MRSITSQIIACLFLLLFSCDTKKDRKDFIISERNLIPEGVAFDTRTQTIYVGSTFKRKIVQISDDGQVTDFIPQEFEGVTSLVGMEVDEERGVLWANTAHANEVMPLINADTTRDWITNISSFDIQSGKLIRKYELHVQQAFFNDLTVTPDGTVFATESVNSKIYRIKSQDDSLEVFVEPKEYNFLNGITYSGKSNALFVSSVEGILKIDIRSKKYELLKISDNIDAKGIDGLAFYQNKLIGHQSSKVSLFHLNENENEIVKVEILDSGKDFDSSTTGEVGEGYYYFIVNSQIQSGIDKSNHTIKPSDSLNDIIIRKIKL